MLYLSLSKMILHFGWCLVQASKDRDPLFSEAGNLRLVVPGEETTLPPVFKVFYIGYTISLLLVLGGIYIELVLGLFFYHCGLQTLWPRSSLACTGLCDSLSWCLCHVPSHPEGSSIPLKQKIPSQPGPDICANRGHRDTTIGFLFWIS